MFIETFFVRVPLLISNCIWSNIASLYNVSHSFINLCTPTPGTIYMLWCDRVILYSMSLWCSGGPPAVKQGANNNGRQSASLGVNAFMSILSDGRLTKQRTEIFVFLRFTLCWRQAMEIHYWLFVREIRCSSVLSPHIGPVLWSLMFSLLLTWKNYRISSRFACDLRCHDRHVRSPYRSISLITSTPPSSHKHSPP